MSVEDPGIWKQISEWLWAILLFPVAGLWKKVDASASRAELREAFETAVKHSREAFESADRRSSEAFKAAEKRDLEARESIKKLFENAENDRRGYDARFTTMQESIHQAEITIVREISALKSVKK
jgi:hypothetical protein